MKKLFGVMLVGFSLFLAAPVSRAEDLLQAYHQAQRSDPTFKAAEAQWLAARQLAPISRSYLLPSLVTQGSVQEQNIDQSFFEETNVNATNTQFELSLTQAIFNYKAWQQYKTAKAQVRQALATYYAAAQDLMVRVSRAYFNVLQAYDALQNAEAQTHSLAEQYHQTMDQFKVGLIAVTGVEQVRASYDAAVAQEISAKNNVSERLEELRAITGVFYTHLVGIGNGVHLVAPAPRDINAWVQTAMRQNFSLQAAAFGTVAAHETVKAQRAGHLPVIEAVGSYQYQRISQFQLGLPNEPDAEALAVRTASIGVQGNLPIYQGGLVTAQTRQAAYQYAEASAEQEQAYRSVLSQTREAYLDVISGISKIQADRQTVRSNNTSLRATKDAYSVGTNTVVDVLQQQSSWYSAQTAYTIDQYSYVLSLLGLKQAAGTLGERDIAVINCWLNKPIDLSAFNFNVQEPSYPKIIDTM